MKKETLTSIISECVHKVINEQLLCEMAYPRNVYKEYISSLSPQIIENWCLINYATLAGNMKELKAHWQKELLTHIGRLSSMKLKRNNSFDNRYKVIFEVWRTDREYASDPNVIKLMITGKFITENIQINTDLFNNVCVNCMNASDDIISTIAYANNDRAVNYVMTL